MIIDRHAGPARETRALGVQARTLEIYSVLARMTTSGSWVIGCRTGACRFAGTPSSSDSSSTPLESYERERLPVAQRLLDFAASGPVTDLFDALDDLRFQLLVIGQPPPVDWPPQVQSDWIRVHAIPANSGNDAELRQAHPRAVVLSAAPGRPCRIVGRLLRRSAADRYLSGRLALRAEGSVSAQ